MSDKHEFKSGEKAIYDNQLVTIIEVLSDTRASIRLDGVHIHVDIDELNPFEIPDHLKKLHPALIKRAREELKSGQNSNAAYYIADSYRHQLKALYEATLIATQNLDPAGWFEPFGNVISAAKSITDLDAGWVESKAPQYRITEKGCELLNVDYPVKSPDSGEKVAITPSRPHVEIKTLQQDIGTPERLKKADAQLADHLNDDWYVVNIHHTAGAMMKRLIMLQRWTRSDPTGQSETSAAAAASIPVRVPEPALAQNGQQAVEPVGPSVNWQPGAFAGSILANGLEATLNAADQRAMDRFKEAFEDANAPATTRPFPALTGEV